MTNEAGSPTPHDRYEERILAFIDILGWKKLVERSVGDLNLVGEMMGMASVLSFTGRIRRSVPNGSLASMRIESSHFSDTVVVSAPVSDNRSVTAFLTAVVSTCFGVLDTFHHYTRGAIVVGKLIHESDRIFGPALNEAYLLESEVAKYPRVLVTPRARAVLESTAPAWAHEAIRVDRDGLAYLSLIVRWLVSEGVQTTCQRIRPWVEAQRKADEGNANHYSKHGWVLSQLDELEAESSAEPNP